MATSMHDEILQKMHVQGLVDIVGGGDAREVGQQNLAILRDLARLEPHMSILDFGCGCGRVALPLLENLSPKGRYTGVDIIPRLVEFCHQEIASQYANAHFFLSSANNKLYEKFIADGQSSVPTISDLNELGTGQFDIIAAFSVFTHLSHSQSRECLGKLATLLRPGGKLLLSCFLVNASSRDHIIAGDSSIAFDVNDIRQDKKAYYIDKKGGLVAVAFQEEELHKLAREAGLEPFITHHGQWCGRHRRHSYQDIVVFTDPPRLPTGFDARSYLNRNPDLPWSPDRNGLRHATEHFLQHGYFERRQWK